MKRTKTNKNKTVRNLSIAITVLAGIACVIHIIALVYIISANIAIHDPDVVSGVANKMSYNRESGVSGTDIIIGSQQMPLVLLFQQGLNYILVLTIVCLLLSIFPLITGILGIIFCRKTKKMKSLFILNIISSITSFFSLLIVITILTIINAVNIHKIRKPKNNEKKHKHTKTNKLTAFIKEKAKINNIKTTTEDKPKTDYSAIISQEVDKSKFDNIKKEKHAAHNTKDENDKPHPIIFDPILATKTTHKKSNSSNSIQKNKPKHVKNNEESYDEMLKHAKIIDPIIEGPRPKYKYN